MIPMRVYSPKQSWLLLSFACLLFMISLYFILSERRGLHGILRKNPRHIAVEVMGDIPNPGIYSFPEEVTVKRALLETGGMGGRKLSNPHLLNTFLKPGSKIIVAEDERRIVTLELTRMEPEQCLVFSIPLDLNEVEEEHLKLIPGIGPHLAHKIIQYRYQKGEFQKIEELMEVTGIGEKKLRTLKQYLIVPEG
jgi:competence protein ComEA